MTAGTGPARGAGMVMSRILQIGRRPDDAHEHSEPVRTTIMEGMSIAEFAESSIDSMTHRRDDRWGRQLPYWHAVFVAILAAVVLIMFLEPAGRYGRLADLACVVALGIAYVLGCYAGMWRDNGTAGRLYTAAAWGIVAIFVFVNPEVDLWILYFILFPQLWALLGRKSASVGTFLVVAVISALRWMTSDKSPDMVTGLVVASAITITLSLGLGLFIAHLTEESVARADTIAELRKAQEQLAASEHERGIQAERERVSREIHDTLAQGFTSVITLSRAAEAALSRGDVDAARERLALIEGTAKDNLSEARIIVAEMTPGHLQSRSLVEALQRLCDAVTRESEMTVRLDIVGEPAPLGGRAEVVFLRTAQEALANVRRHARADSVTVLITYADRHRVELVVTDDGIGFDDDNGHRGFGLDGMAARAQAVGGTASVHSALGSGTTIRLEIPR